MWPELLYAPWRDTAATLHLWMQIVGKVRLSLTPWVNHSWQVPLYVSARGLTTSPMPIGAEVLELEFDFISHRLAARTSRGEERSLALEPQAVADFYARLGELLGQLGVAAETSDMPCELPNPIRFPEDRVHCSYDAEAAHRFWRALLRIDALLKLFRSGFIGKVSPVHFFWGSFDLAVTRFSGWSGAGARRCGDARSVLARGEQRRLLAGQRFLPARRVLFLRVPAAGRIR